MIIEKPENYTVAWGQKGGGYETVESHCEPEADVCKSARETHKVTLQYEVVGDKTNWWQIIVASSDPLLTR
jgi:hypothetical protein